MRNLEERIKLPQLCEALEELFSEYGTIIDIVAKPNLKARGQAFIVFDSVESATKAIEEVQGFELFDKPMQLAFARTRSDASVKREKGDGDEFESHKRRRLAEKGMDTVYDKSTKFFRSFSQNLVQIRKKQLKPPRNKRE